MRNYILQILLKHPKGRTQAENITLVRYIQSVNANNENWERELAYFNKINDLFDNLYQTQ